MKHGVTGTRSVSTACACHLVFVYNSDASLSSLLSEVAHKLFSPDSFECSLCELTYSHVRKKRGWVEFLERLPCRHEFHLRNRFVAKHPQHAADSFPCIYTRAGGGELNLLVGAAEIDSAHSLEALQETIAAAVAQRFPS